MVEFPVPLLTLLQPQNYPVSCISPRVFIIPKLLNIHWRQFFTKITLGELFSQCIEHLPDCYSVRPSPFSLYNCFPDPDWSFREQLSRALPTVMIFYLLRLIPSERLIRDYSTELMLDTLEVIVKWFQVSISDATDKPLTLKSRIVSWDLVPSDRAACKIASRANSFDSLNHALLQLPTLKLEI